MKERELVCIVCPVGCRLRVRQGEDGEFTVEGNTCTRGLRYAVDECSNPRRTLTTSVPVTGGHMKLVSVKSAQPLPKERIDEVLAALRTVRARAPLNVGDVILPDAAGTGIAIVATRAIRAVRP